MAKELWDAYDREGNRLGFDLVRGEPVPGGAYHLVVEVLAVTHDVWYRPCSQSRIAIRFCAGNRCCLIMMC